MWFDDEDEEEKKEFKFHKFKRGDEVEYLGNRCKVVGILPRDEKTGENMYQTKTAWSSYIQKAKESEIKFYTGDLKKNTESENVGKYCPRCGTEWSVSGFGATKWKDCIKCKKKAEDMI